MWRSFGIPFVVLERLYVLIHVAVMLSEAKHLWLLRAVPDQRIEILLPRLRGQNDKRSVSFFRVTDRIFDSGFAKTFEPQQTRVAFAAGQTFRRRIITAVGERKIDTELDRFQDDFGF